MFKTSFRKVLRKAKTPLPYIGSISFDDLQKAKSTIVGRPISCQCGAILVDAKQVTKDPNLGLTFSCKYCGVLNVVDPADLARYPDVIINDVDFIIKEPTELTTTHISKAGSQNQMVAIIDISGSMSKGKLEAVKNSLIDTIKDLKANAPRTNFLLITFESKVYLYELDGTSLMMPEDYCHDRDKIISWFSKYQDRFHPIQKSADQWIEVVQQLKPMDYTALGPALLGGISVIGKSTNSRIILLTDGLANRGLGKLEGVSTSGKTFYDEMAAICKKQSIIVEVVGVSNTESSNMALQILGKLAVETGGDIYFVTSEELTQAFETMRGMDYIGRQVEIGIKYPEQLALSEVTGVAAGTTPSKENIPLGAVTTDREIFFELNPSKSIKQPKVPIQTQIQYVDKEGRTHLRVVTKDFETTENEDEFTKSYDAKILTGKALQKAGEILYSSSLDESQEMLEKTKAELASQSANINDAEESLELMDMQINEYKQIKEDRKKEPKHRSVQKTMVGQAAPMSRDAEIAYSLKQMRGNVSKRFKKDDDDDDT